MRRVLALSFCTAALWGGLTAVAAHDMPGCESSPAARPPERQGDVVKKDRFRVFDATLFRGKPDLRPYGLEPVTVLYESELFFEGGSEAQVPDIRIRRAVARAGRPPGLYILDVERWQWLPDAAARYADLIRRFRAAAGSCLVGYYSIVPKRDYWRAKEGPGSSDYGVWQQENNALQSVAAEVDVLMPSLYTFYDYPPGWAAYAAENVREARRLAKGKPVYVFLWPMYHESNLQLRGRSIPGPQWREELEIARRIADGVVIWGGGPWDPDSDWWAETRRFLASLAVERSP